MKHLPCDEKHETVFLKQSKHLKREKQNQTLCTKGTQFSYRKDKEKFNITNESNKKISPFPFL